MKTLNLAKELGEDFTLLNKENINLDVKETILDVEIIERISNAMYDHGISNLKSLLYLQGEYVYTNSFYLIVCKDKNYLENQCLLNYEYTIPLKLMKLLSKLKPKYIKIKRILNVQWLETDQTLISYVDPLLEIPNLVRLKYDSLMASWENNNYIKTFFNKNIFFEVLKIFYNLYKKPVLSQGILSKVDSDLILLISEEEITFKDSKKEELLISFKNLRSIKVEKTIKIILNYRYLYALLWVLDLKLVELSFANNKTSYYFPPIKFEEPNTKIVFMPINY